MVVGRVVYQTRVTVERWIGTGQRNVRQGEFCQQRQSDGEGEGEDEGGCKALGSAPSVREAFNGGRSTQVFVEKE
jgi:hypothetical protein